MPATTREPFFPKRGYVAKQRNTVTVNGEWLANTTMQKTLGAGARAGSSVMSRERLYLFDTTLRDGAQTNGVDFTLHDKRMIAEMLDELGIDYVEGGYPGANPTDTEFFAEKPKLDHARFTAFGMTRRPGRSASNDPGLAALLEAKADAICFVAKSSAYQVRVALETTNEENLASIRDSVKAAKAAGREVMLDCEHFFDGYKENAEFALACARAAYDSGARWVVLCDTNGGTMPHEVETIVTRGDEAYSRRSRRHSRPQRHRTGRGQFAGGGARRRAADPGHAERSGRTLRQRQSVFADPDPAAQARVFRCLRNRGVAGQDGDPDEGVAHAGRHAQSRARIAMRPMSAKARSSPRPAFMRPRS